MCNKTGSIHKLGLSLCLLAGLCACSGSLDSQDGPKTGVVSGIVCNELPTLAAAMEMPAVQGTLISEGKCIRLTRSEQVKFLRTVMMPADGKYSQFEVEVKGSSKKMWIRTSNVRDI